MLNKDSLFIPSTYPIVKRDFSFVMDDDVSCDSLLQSIRSSTLLIVCEKLSHNNVDDQHGMRKTLPYEFVIDQIDVFDVYNGDQIPEGKKCISVTVYIMPTKSTLTSEQIKEICDNIISRVEWDTGSTLRSVCK